MVRRLMEFPLSEFARTCFVTCERCSRRQQFDIVTNSTGQKLADRALSAALVAALVAAGWSERKDGDYCPDCVRSES